MSPLKIIRPRHYAQNTEQVVAKVYELIREQNLTPGDRLPPERRLAEQLGISRSALRAGFSSLISMHVLQSRQGSGTFLVDGGPTLDSEPLRLLAELHGFSYEHMFETRSILEVGAAGLAAERATDAQLDTMSEEIAKMYGALGDPQQFLVRDIAFHRTLASASGNPTLATLIEMVSVILYERRRDTIERADDFNEALDRHRQIYGAIRSHKPEEARETMCGHILGAQRAFALEEKQQQKKLQQQEERV